MSFKRRKIETEIIRETESRLLQLKTGQETIESMDKILMKNMGECNLTEVAGIATALSLYLAVAEED